MPQEVPQNILTENENLFRRRSNELLCNLSRARIALHIEADETEGYVDMLSVQRPIKRILIANRGEIAIRILQACHELADPPETYGVYTDDDTTHISLGRPSHVIRLPSPGSYMDIAYLIDLVKKYNIDAVHPGYGFLSESAEFSRRMWEEANVMVIGPGWEVLERTGDKLKAKALAEECGVPVLKAMKSPTSRVEDVRQFAKIVGYPIIIKAVDGGGGRGIRLMESATVLENAVERCIGESPSRTVFAEQAAVNGFKHIEVQIVGDGRGGVKHVWERDCSIQRRFQKIVEIAPAPVADRTVIAQVIDSAIKMARKLRYLGLGTFEFLVSTRERKFFFLEINPRLQVEHTISECISGVNLVRKQLLIAQGMQDEHNSELGEVEGASRPPNAFSIQLRLCAEDPNSNFALSIGKVTDVIFPSGNGVRVDSHLSKGGTVGSDFDNLMAKIIVTASTWDETVGKARRALAETRLSGVKTNLNLLRAIVIDEAFVSGTADTRWLETEIQRLVDKGNHIGNVIESATAALPPLPSATGHALGVSSTNIVFRKGDAWSLRLEEAGKPSPSKTPAHRISINRVVRNQFPEELIADLSYTMPGTSPKTYRATVTSRLSSTAAVSSSHRRGDPSNKSHIVVPISGKLIEVLVEEGDVVHENEVVGFVK